MLKHPLVKGLIDLVFPPLCLGCGAFTEEPSGVCQTCWNKLDTYEHPLCLDCFAPLSDVSQCWECGREPVPLFTYGHYSSPHKEIIIQLKFRGIKLPAVEFPLLLHEMFRQQLNSLQADMLLPIPLHPARERERGYNQATLLAETLAELLDLPVREDILIRTKKRKPQAKLTLKKRDENIKGVFSVVAEASGDGERVMVVDDVVTSGATVREAGKVLEQAGYQVVAVVSMAHGQ